jgi:hypothetical protein
VRVRLLLDVDLDVKEVGVLADLIATQEGASVQIQGFRLLGARLMGAVPVEAEPHD